MKEEIRIVADVRALAREGGRLFTDGAREAVRARGRFSVVLPGGRTPRELFRLLASHREDKLPWPAIHFFWTDERMVSPEHDRSNYRVAFEDMISRVPIPSLNVHRIHGEIPAGKAAAAIEGELAGYFGEGAPPAFDLVFLGLGEDGHTASLFPGSPALEEVDSFAVATTPPRSPGDARVTLTLPALEGARMVVFLVSGKEKAEVVRRIFRGGAGRLDSPAGRVRPRNGRLVWLLDREAAALLP